MKKTYKSKISYFLLIFVFLVTFVPIIIGSMESNINVKTILMVLGGNSLIYAFVLHLFLKTQYTIDNNELKIKAGLFKFKPIDINQIKQISKTKSIMSSPAASFDRIEIKYGKFDDVIISPKDKMNFIKDLLKINPNIKNTLGNL